MRISPSLLKKHLERLESEPENLDVLNDIAIGYFQNYAQKTDKEDYDFFKRAYELQKTVKSTHNFAWFLYFEWSEISWRWGEEAKDIIEKAIIIQKECIALCPQSYYPYFLLGYLLLNEGREKEAIQYLEVAYEKKEEATITHNLGYCWFKLENYTKAKHFFSLATQHEDLGKKSLFNLAITEQKLGNEQTARSIAKQLFDTIELNNMKEVDGFDIGFLYFLLHDFKQSAAATIKQGVGCINLVEWDALSFSIWYTNRGLWQQEIENRIDLNKKYLTEILENHPDWEASTEEEKDSQFMELVREIAKMEEMLEKGPAKPSNDSEFPIHARYCGCLLFGCTMHDNLENDEVIS